MKKMKNMICVWLVLIMVFTTGTPAFAVDKAALLKSTVAQDAAEGTDTTDSPFDIEIKSDKDKYRVTGVASVTVKVTNISNEPVENVSAEALFDGLVPVGTSSTLKAEAQTLNQGESLSFSYNAMIASNQKGLSFFQRIILFFKYLFKRIISVTDNGFDNGRSYIEESKMISFGKYDTVNTVRVWYGETKTTYFNENDAEKMQIVDLSIKQLMSSEGYQDKEEQDRIQAVEELLLKLEKDGLIGKNSINYNDTTKIFDFKYACGISGGILIKKEKEKSSDPWLRPIGITNEKAEVIKQKSKANSLVTTSNSKGKAILMYGFDEPNAKERVFSGWSDLCKSTGLETTVLDCPTVFEFKTELLNKDFICIFEHGVSDALPNTYVFRVMGEEVTAEKDLAYNTDIYFERVIKRFLDDSEVHYLITPKFFEFYYNDKLSNSIVYMCSCKSFGEGSTINYGIADTLIEHCGVQAVLGFHNSVVQAYAYRIYSEIVDLLQNGFTVGEAYDLTTDELGTTDYEFLKKYLFEQDDISKRIEWLNLANQKKENNEIATFLISGNRNARLCDNNESIIDSGTCGENVTWTLNSKGELKITGTGDMYNYSGFYSYEDAPWISSREKIFYVSINMGITSIGAGAFIGCYFNRITIPNSIISIGDAAFKDCQSLTHITIPNSVTSIGSQAFIDCINLNEIVFSNSIKRIGDGAFSYCSSLTRVTLPNSITSIDTSTFHRCSNLTDIDIPNSVTSIGIGAFYECISLKSLTIPSSVTNIEYLAFQGCSSLTNITIPNSVTMVGGNTFANCSSLKSIILSNKLSAISPAMFFRCTSLTSIVIPESVKNIDEGAFRECSSLASITIPNSVTTIEGYAFMDCTSLVNITLSNRITAINEYAFCRCSSLNNVVLPEGLTSIKYAAFEDCRSLTKINIPNGITVIDSGLFAGCRNLTSINLPQSVQKIDYGAFRECDRLQNIYYSGTKNQWDKIIIEGYNEALNDATIHYNSQ